MLMCFLLFAPVATSQGWAQENEDFDLWQDDVDYPPMPPAWGQPGPDGSAAPGFFSSMPAKQPKKAPSLPAAPSEKKGWWPFRKKEKPPSEAEMQVKLNVGPRENPPAKGILFRLPMAILSENGPLEPGFYLAEPRAVDAHTRELLIRKRNKDVLKLTATTPKVAEPTGPVQPIEGRSAPAPTPLMNVRVGPGGASLQFVLQEGSQVFETPPVRTETDRRPQIRY